MRKDSVQVVRSRLTLLNPDEAPDRHGLCLDSVKVEGVFQSPEGRNAPAAEGGSAVAPAEEGPPALVEVNITSHRFVIFKRKS